MNIEETYNNFYNININDDTPKIDLSNCKWVQKFINVFNNQNINEWKSTEIKIVNKRLPNGNMFMSARIKKWILNNPFYKIKYVNSKYGTVNIYASQQKDFKNFNIINCLKMIQTLQQYSVNKMNSSETSVLSCLLPVEKHRDKYRIVNIEIILTDFKKKLPTVKEQPIDCDNVNSGVSDEVNVILWRKEEVMKVLTHELIHHYELDFGGIRNDDQMKKINSKFFKKFRVHNKYGLIINETITETLATIINCILCHLETNKDVTKLLTYEVWHTFIQVSKILNHYNFKSFEEFMGINESDKILEEKTNVFAYFIAKSFLLYELPNVIQLLNIENDRTIENYINILSTIRISDDYIAIINWLMKQNIADRSLRMTLS